MKRESAAWAVIGFLAAMSMGSMAAPSTEIGRWQLLKEFPGGTDFVVFDTATGATWALQGDPSRPPPAGWSELVKKAWVEIGPPR